MLVNSVILILREVLEAALLISVLLALSQKIQLSKKWLIPGFILGSAGAAIYAINIEAVSMTLEGAGQEALNACMHILIYFFIAVLMITIKSHQHRKALIFAMSSCVFLAITREGSEIIIYLNGFFSIPKFLVPVAIGSVIGAGIGISIGILFYYFITNISSNNGNRFGLILLILIAGGMILQSTQLLIQADLILSQQPLWDSSALLSERSLFGQLLYALLGYEATPTPIQIVCYIVSSLIMIFLANKSLRHMVKRENYL